METIEEVAMAKYAWELRPGSRVVLTPEQLAEVSPIIEAAVQAEVDPADALLDRARDEASAIHGYFNWDDEACGKMYRRHQATTLLNALQRVRIVVRGGRTPSAAGPPRALVVLRPGDYAPGADVEEEAVPAEPRYCVPVLTEAQQRLAYMRSAVSRVASHLIHVEQFEELDFLRDAIRKAQRITGLLGDEPSVELRLGELEKVA
jgi:hypothetical protein